MFPQNAMPDPMDYPDDSGAPWIQKNPMKTFTPFNLLPKDKQTIEHAQLHLENDEIGDLGSKSHTPG